MVKIFKANILNWFKTRLNSVTNNIKMNGTQNAGSSELVARADHVHPTDTSRAASTHTHGNVSNDGKVGTVANKPLITGTNGVVQAGSFGTAANTFCQGNDSRLSNARTPVSHTDSNGAYGKATTSVWGHTKLNSATNSTDETTAATPKAVKAAYDLANGKITNGTGTVTSTNIADKTIVNGDIADNAAIAYSKLSGVVSSTDSRLSNARTPIFNHIDASSSVAKNLNDYKTGGFYYTQSNSGDVPYVANRPGNRNYAFFLLVETWGASSTNYVKQTLTYYDTNITYIRTCNNGTWSAWAALIKEGDSRLSDARTPKSHTHTKSEISDFPTSMTPTSHTHGNITNAGAIGSTANLPVITTTSGKLTTGSFGTAANTFCQGNDSRLTNARTPTAHASTGTTYGASSASNYGHSMASSTSPKAPGTANVGSETAKFARGDHVHPLQSSTTTTLSLVNTAAMSGTVKCTESNGWGVVYFEGLKSTTTTTGYTQFATLPHTSKATIYANFNLDATGTNAILLRVRDNYLEGRILTANQRMYGHIIYPVAV